MNREGYLYAAALLLAVSGIACDPRAFSDLQDSTWVDVTGRPDGLDSDEYVTAMTVAATADTDGTTFVVAGSAAVGIGTVHYDGGGSLTSEGNLVTRLNTDIAAVSFGDTPALAGAPALLQIGGNSVDAFAVGLPNDGIGGEVFVAGRSPIDQLARITAPAGVLELGTAVALSTSATSSVDLVASGRNTLVIVPDIGQAATPTLLSCTIDRERGYQLLAADFDTASAGDELVVMGGDLALGTASVVHVMSPAQIQAADGTPCFGTTAPLVSIAAPGGEPDFGLLMAAADFNGAGGLDLALAAPSAKVVYVYFDLDPNAAAPTPDVMLTVSGTSIGAMAAGDINGGGAELVIGDPGASPEGTTGAGAAYLYELDGTAFQLAVTLHDADAEENQRFGRSVVVAPFGTGDSIVAVGSAGELFTYFETALTNDTDVRQ